MNANHGYACHNEQHACYFPTRQRFSEEEIICLSARIKPNFHPYSDRLSRLRNFPHFEKTNNESDYEQFSVPIL